MRGDGHQAPPLRAISRTRRRNSSPRSSKFAIGVEARAGRRQQHDIAGLGDVARLGDGFCERRDADQLRPLLERHQLCVRLDRCFEQRAIGAEEDDAGAAPKRFFGELILRQVLVLAAEQQHQRLVERPDAGERALRRRGDAVVDVTDAFDLGDELQPVRHRPEGADGAGDVVAADAGNRGDGGGGEYVLHVMGATQRDIFQRQQHLFDGVVAEERGAIVARRLRLPGRSPSEVKYQAVAGVSSLISRDSSSRRLSTT